MDPQNLTIFSFVICMMLIVTHVGGVEHNAACTVSNFKTKNNLHF